MADALDISGSLSYDGDQWFTDDPITVHVTVRDPDGTPLPGAGVTIGLVGHDTRINEDTAFGSTDSSGEVSLSLTALDQGVYRVQVGASTGAREGYVDLGTLHAVEKPPFTVGQGGLVGLFTDYTLIDNAISETTLE